MLTFVPDKDRARTKSCARGKKATEMRLSKPRSKRGLQAKSNGLGLYYPTDDTSIEEWFDTRSMMYADLPNHSIPIDIIRAILDHREHEPVFWLSESGDIPTRDQEIVVRVVRPPQTLADNQSLDQSNLGVETWPPENWPKTTGEALAHFLSCQIDSTRRLSAARWGKNLPKATIAWVANDLLETCRDHPPGYFLKELIRKLLDVDRLKKNQSKQYSARSRAKWIVAQAQHLDSEQIARELGVDRSSVSRWRRDPSFKEEVSNIQRYIARLKELGRWSDGPSGGPHHPPLR